MTAHITHLVCSQPGSRNIYARTTLGLDFSTGKTAGEPPTGYCWPVGGSPVDAVLLSCVLQRATVMPPAANRMENSDQDAGSNNSDDNTSY